jgi:Aspartyl/asparaginyl beta-hydroxylase and related dioxygenases
VLHPGTHILPHRGVTNTRLVAHLPLIVPRDCALNVGGEIHAWPEGRCVIFDDTFEHEAWNRSDQTRVVLIMDCWNPDLSAAERAAIAELVAGIGDFNRSCGLPGIEVVLAACKLPWQAFSSQYRYVEKIFRVSRE